MAVMTGADLRFATEPVLNKHFDGVYKDLPSEYSQVFDVGTGMQRRFYEEIQLMGFGAASEKGEGANVVYDSGGEAFRQVIRYVRYALAFALTEDLVDDAELVRVATLFSTHLARSMKETKEVVHADILNRAITSGYNGGDGVVLLSASHPLGGGGTFSNYLASTDLSDYSLKQVLISVRKAVDERSKRINLQPKQLVVPPDGEYAANEILFSKGRSGTANNDLNTIMSTQRLSKVQVMTRLTTAASWFVQTDAPNGLISRQHPMGGMKKGMEGDFETANMRYKASERYAASWVDPRGIYGSMGA